MLKSAFNAITLFHSRPATLKRLGTVDMYSPCRVTPANYFRFLAGPEYTTIKGIELIIPVDSIKGQFAQKLFFDAVPDAGVFKIMFGVDLTNDINFDATAADIQTEIQLIPAYANIQVTGDFATGFLLTFAGFSSSVALGSVVASTLELALVPVVASWQHTNIPWSGRIKKGDRLLDGGDQWSIDEIIHMHDAGATVMGYRCRMD